MVRHVPLYDRIGFGYAAKRHSDRCWAAHIDHALGDARSVLNVGAGTGSYEPASRSVIALEPSLEMIAQRPNAAAPVVRGVAAALPFPDSSFDATLAVLTLHHWPDINAGLAELQRASARQVIVTWDVSVFAEQFWFTREYLPSVGPEDHLLADASLIASQLEDAEVLALPVPYDCTDGFFAAYWRRPEAYLDPAVRASISGLALFDPTRLADAISKLDADLRSGAWHRNHPELLDKSELDVGYRLVVGGSAV